jgi:hypothetical protein
MIGGFLGLGSSLPDSTHRSFLVKSAVPSMLSGLSIPSKFFLYDQLLLPFDISDHTSRHFLPNVKIDEKGRLVVKSPMYSMSRFSRLQDLGLL